MKKLLFLSISTAVLFFGCKKSADSGSTNNPPAPPDLTTKINSSVTGFVTDANDAAVLNATVQLGASTVTTDKYGYFELRNTEVVQNAAVVTITKPGYFKAVKTYIAVAGKVPFFRIKLIPKTIAGTINSSAGGSVTLSNGLTVTIPANAVVNATTNVAYSGTINVAAYWINPTSTDLPRIMPGDLRGLDTDGNLQLLTSYGMAAVELTGSGGELLQIATGKKASLSSPIPSSISAGAPATIPLWYFDENKGLWKQEGTATKNGNNYVGDVSHFSFWNYDLPSSYVQFNCTLVNQTGQPLQNALIKISVISDPSNTRYGFTDTTGYAGGPIPANAQLRLEVFSSAICFTTLYTQTFTTTAANTSLGTVTINTSAFQAIVSGTVTNCANTPVTNGYIVMQSSNQNYRYPVTNGTFNFPTNLCSAPAVVSITAEDITNAQKSVTSNYTLNAGNNSIGNIKACGVVLDEFMNFTVDGTPYSFSAPQDGLFQDTVPGSPVQFWLYSAPNPNWVAFEFDKPNTAVNSNQQLTFFNTPVINDTITINNPPILVHITEFGSVGQYFAGNFSGVLKGKSPANKLYNITCSFRIKRQN